MNKIKVLIANINNNFIEEIIEEFNEYDILDVVSVANDGEEAISKIEKYNPSIVIVDLLLPVIDGIAVVDYISTLNIKPLIVITGAAISDKCYEMLLKKGVKLVMEQPIDPKVLKMKILKYVRE